MPRPNNALVPVPNTQVDFYDWAERRQCKTAQIVTTPSDLIFIGDSITHMFEMPERGHKVWNQYFGKYQPINLGYGWDCTQNVLWRLENGEFENQHPKAVVLNIGTNNLTGNSAGRANTAAEIVEAISKICRLIHKRSPATTIIVMSVFPRGSTSDPIFAQARELAALIGSTVAERPGLVHLDVTGQFLAENGEISRLMMDDLVHPTEAGYILWAESLYPLIAKLVC